jgi:hypothetical protein
MGYPELESLGTAASNGSIVPTADNDQYIWRIHGMMSVNTLRKPAVVPLYQLCIPHGLAKD